MIDITDKIDNYINKQNEELWKELSTKHTFRLMFDSKESSWLMDKNLTEIDIICPNLEINYAAFTHELLHVYIEDLGMPDYETVYSLYKHHKLFGNFIFTNLFGYIYNFSCHKKMFPYYKNMGFSEYNFVQQRIDYNWRRHLKVSFFLKINKFKILGIEQFLGNFFSLKNNVVLEDNKKCEKYLNKLKKLNPELYSIAERFDESWENRNDFNFSEPFIEFRDNLQNWIIKTYAR